MDSSHAYLDGIELLGEAASAADIASAQRQMNALKNVSVKAARVLIRGGLGIIDEALAAGELGGKTSRENVRGHLKWHEDAANKISDLKASYPHANDLKDWVMRAYVESFAAGKAEKVGSTWADMWKDVKEIASDTTSFWGGGADQGSVLPSGVSPGSSSAPLPPSSSSPSTAPVSPFWGLFAKTQETPSGNVPSGDSPMTSPFIVTPIARQPEPESKPVKRGIKPWQVGFGVLVLAVGGMAVAFWIRGRPTGDLT